MNFGIPLFQYLWQFIGAHTSTYLLLQMPLQSVWPLHSFLAHFFPWLTDNTHSNRTLSQMLSGMLIWLKRFHQHLQAPSSFRPCLFSFPKLYFFPSVTLVISVRSQGNCLPCSFHSHCFFWGDLLSLKELSHLLYILSLSSHFPSSILCRDDPHFSTLNSFISWNTSLLFLLLKLQSSLSHTTKKISPN